MRALLLPLLGLSLAAGAPPRARLASAHALPPMDGSRLSVKVLEVNYGPGESSTPHRHPFPVVVYVLQGAVRTQVEGQPSPVVYRAGESFYEAPGAVHLVSANASATEPARFLAIFTCDHEAELSASLPEGQHP